MPAEKPFDPSRFLTDQRQVGHATLLGIRYAGHGDDWAELAMPVDPRFAGDATALAFGPLATLLDMAAGFSVWIVGNRFRPHATLDLRIDRLRDPRAGTTLIARGTCLGLAGDVAFVRAAAHDGDPADPVAAAAGSFMLTERWG